MAYDAVQRLNEFGRTRLPGMLGLEILSFTAERVTGRIPVTPPLEGARYPTGSSFQALAFYFRTEDGELVVLDSTFDCETPEALYESEFRSIDAAGMTVVGYNSITSIDGSFPMQSSQSSPVEFTLR